MVLQWFFFLWVELLQYKDDLIVARVIFQEHMITYWTCREMWCQWWTNIVQTAKNYLQYRHSRKNNYYLYCTLHNHYFYKRGRLYTVAEKLSRAVRARQVVGDDPVAIFGNANKWTHHPCYLLLPQPVNVAAWSPCGRFLAAGAVGGLMVVWEVSNKACVERYDLQGGQMVSWQVWVSGLTSACCPRHRQKHEKGFTVCCLAWHPSGSQLAYTDTEGRLGLLDGITTPSTTDSAKVGTIWPFWGGNTLTGSQWRACSQTCLSESEIYELVTVLIGCFHGVKKDRILKIWILLHEKVVQHQQKRALVTL